MQNKITNNWDTKINQWKKEIEEIRGDVEDMLYSRYQAEELVNIIKSNDFIKNNVGTFWTHYKLNLIYFLISKIWHQIDENNQSLSLVNLLNNLVLNCKVITKDWWVSQSKEGWLSPKEFEKNFGKEFLDPCIVDQDIQKLKNATKKVKKMRHKRIAHTDKNRKLYSQIEAKEIKKSIDVIEELVIKYLLLLTQSGRDSLTPIEDDWHKTFTQPWIQ